MPAERRHGVAEGVAVRYLVDEAKQRSDASDVLWRRKVTDCAVMFVTGLDIGRSDDETSKSTSQIQTFRDSEQFRVDRKCLASA